MLLLLLPVLLLRLQPILTMPMLLLSLLVGFLLLLPLVIGLLLLLLHLLAGVMLALEVPALAPPMHAPAYLAACLWLHATQQRRCCTLLLGQGRLHRGNRQLHLHYATMHTRAALSSTWPLRCVGCCCMGADLPACMAERGHPCRACSPDTAMHGALDLACKCDSARMCSTAA